MKTVQLNARVPQKVRESINKTAEAEDKSVNSYITDIHAEHLGRKMNGTVDVIECPGCGVKNKRSKIQCRGCGGSF